MLNRTYTVHIFVLGLLLGTLSKRYGDVNAD